MTGQGEFRGPSAGVDGVPRVRDVLRMLRAYAQGVGEIGQVKSKAGVVIWCQVYGLPPSLDRGVEVRDIPRQPEPHLQDTGQIGQEAGPVLVTGQREVRGLPAGVQR